MKKALLLSVIALAACTQAAPVSREVATQAAVACFGWPASVQQSASVLQAQAPSDTSFVLDFRHGKRVTVGRDGTCGDVVDTQLRSATPLSQLPPASFTRSGDGVYVLLLLGENENGERQYFGARGGMALLELSRPAEPPGPLV